MKFKKTIISAMALMGLFGSVLYAEEELPKDKPGTAVFVMSTEQNSKIMVSTDCIEEITDGLQVNMKIPVMNHFKSSRLQRKINKEIKQNQLCLKSGIEKDAIRCCPVHPYELMTNYNVKSNDAIFSLEITVYDYRGGAHGMTKRTYYNIDTKNSKLLTLEDMGSAEIINEEINKQIKERQQQSEIFFEDDQGFNGIKENQSFYISEDHELVIVFGLYEIAPYAAGIIEFPISKEKINSSD